MRVRTWASSWFKDPHSLLSPLWDTKPQAPAAQGKPCPPCAGNCRKNRNKKRRVPVWNDKAFVICSEATVHITLRAHVWTLFSTNAQPELQPDARLSCPHCAFAAAAVKQIIFHTEDTVWWTLTAPIWCREKNYPTCARSAVRRRRSITRHVKAAGDKQPLW